MTKVKKTVDIQTLQKLCYEILIDIDDYCRKEGITYFLSGGSCLGAVRHQGFIPWDDDIDLMLPRADYERLIRGFAKWKPEKYGVGALELEPKWVRGSARIWRTDTRLSYKHYAEMDQGIFIDLFPIDGLPEKKWRRKLFFWHTRVLHLGRNIAMQRRAVSEGRAKALKLVLYPLCRCLGARFFGLRFDRLIRRYPYERSKLVGAVSAAHYWDKETMERSVFDHAEPRLFVDRMYPVPCGYDRYLSGLYGAEYMKIPDHAAASHLENWEVTMEE